MLPPTELYRKYLNTASIRYNMTLDECRNKFGLYTEQQWLTLLEQAGQAATNTAHPH